MNLKTRRAQGTELRAATAAIMLHIYFDLRTYALGRLVKRLLGARASERQQPHLHHVFPFLPLSFSARNLILFLFDITLQRMVVTYTNTRITLYYTLYTICCYYITPSIKTNKIVLKKKNSNNASKISKIGIIQIICIYVCVFVYICRYIRDVTRQSIKIKNLYYRFRQFSK